MRYRVIKSFTTNVVNDPTKSGTRTVEEGREFVLNGVVIHDDQDAFSKDLLAWHKDWFEEVPDPEEKKLGDVLF